MYLNLVQGKALRYGENSHQNSYHYRYYTRKKKPPSITSATIVQGKALSYSNLLDADAAYRVASDALNANGSKGIAVAIVKTW